MAVKSKKAVKAKLEVQAPTPKPNKMIEASKRRAAEREKERIAADAKIKGGQETAMKSLAPIAKEVNQILELAQRADDQAHDRRLSAALKLEEARKIAETAKLNFKAWCEKNVTQSYETVRKLVAIGGSKNPKQALEDLRHRNKKANKKLRDKKAAALAVIAAPAETPYIRAEKALDAMKDKDQHTFLDSKAKKIGFRVVSEDDVKVLEQVKRGVAPAPAEATTNGDPIQALQAAFMALKAGQMMAFCKWAAAKVDGTFTSNFDSGDDGLEIPPALDRRAKAAVGVAAAKAKVGRGATATK